MLGDGILVNKSSAIPLKGHSDIITFILVFSLFYLFSESFDLMNTPIEVMKHNSIDLAPINLIKYSAMTITRMLIAAMCSIAFSIVYGIVAAKSARTEKIMIPILEILQSVPILGYLSFVIVFFMSLFPGSALGIELVSIFTIFTSQAWNMTLSVYQSIKQIPTEIKEVAHSFRMSNWQKFWRLYIPFLAPGLFWNLTVSIAGGWFFVVASEAITFNSTDFRLPGIGSYIATAITNSDINSIYYAVLAMMISIILCDSLLFKPLIEWSEKFKYDFDNNSCSSSFLVRIFKQSKLVYILSFYFNKIFNYVLYYKLFNKRSNHHYMHCSHKLLAKKWISPLLYISTLGIIIFYIYSKRYNILAMDIGLKELFSIIWLGVITFTRVMVFLSIAIIIWVPIGIYIGLRPRLSAIISPIAQCLAAFPVNIVFPIVTIAISTYNLNPNIWLGLLLILGSQWYILFNVMAGASLISKDLIEVSYIFNIKGILWFRKLALPEIMPYIITSCITAYGGAFNASIIAEYVQWGNNTYVATGLGSYITKNTMSGDVSKVAVAVVVMSFIVVIVNKILWKPLYLYSINRKL